VFTFTRVPNNNEVGRIRDDASFFDEIFPKIQRFYGISTGRIREETGATKYRLDQAKTKWFDSEMGKDNGERLPLHYASGSGFAQSGWLAIYLPNGHSEFNESRPPAMESLVSLLRTTLGLPQIPQIPEVRSKYSFNLVSVPPSRAATM
jgi:hypothetical protein